MDVLSEHPYGTISAPVHAKITKANMTRAQAGLFWRVRKTSRDTIISSVDKAVCASLEYGSHERTNSS